MEVLSSQEFKGVLEYVAQDIEGIIGIRMKCQTRTLVYSIDDKHERREVLPMNSKVFTVIYPGQLEWGEPMLCKSGDKIIIHRWLTTKQRQDGSSYEETCYGITNETLDAAKGEYVWLGNL